MIQQVQFKYTGSTPGTDSNVYNIFNSVTAFPGARFHQALGLSRLTVNIMNSQAGTLRLYRTSNREASSPTYTQVLADIAVAAVASSAGNFYDLLVVEYPDFKLDWVNGGVTQATWIVDGALVIGHTKAT